MVRSADYHDGIQRFELRNDRYGTHKHSTLSDYQRVVEPEVFRDLFKFAVLRNPWDRMVSFYFSPHRQVTDFDRDRFLNFITRAAAVRSYICTRSIKSRIMERLHLGGAKPLGTQLDYLIKFEQLEQDVSMVCEILKIPFGNLPQYNASKSKHYSVYYDEETRNLVASMFEDEIRAGAYLFES